MITRQLQTAADDLAVFEGALLWLHSQFPLRYVSLDNHENRELIKRVIHPAASLLRKPDLPRCVGISLTTGKSCRQPQERPKGLCALHFIRFAHSYGGSYDWPSGIGGHGMYTCRLCGRKWRYVTGTGESRFIAEIEAERAAAIREVCPAKKYLWDALENKVV